MPFVQRIVEPKYLSRTSLHNENGEPIISDYELEAVTNNTLSNALRQLASLVLVANDIFTELTKELQNVSTRSSALKVKICNVEKKVENYDPKLVAVPEGDISTFAQQTEHYRSSNDFTTGLFTADSRPNALKQLYEQAAKTPIGAMRQLDRWRRDGYRSSRFFVCTPVLEQKRRKLRNKIDIDIETRMPASVDELRRWTSTEAIGDVTVTPDCVNKIPNNTTVIAEDTMDAGATSGDEGVDHKLPSPEEQLQVIALKFPAEIVAVDVSGRSFDRMSIQRRSLLRPEITNGEENGDSTIRRRSRTRKPRGKRRNTLAGTDQKEIVDALTAREESEEPTSPEQNSPEITIVTRSRSSDLLRSSKKVSPPDVKKSHFNTLKQWGKNKLKGLNRSSEKNEPFDPAKTEDIDDINIYETITMRRWRSSERTSKPTHERKQSYSSSEKSSNISLPIATPVPPVQINTTVKMRDNSAQMKQRRNGPGKEDHSSSGNWSASSESGRASIGSEITSTTTQPKSTTSAATSSNSLNQHITPNSIHNRRRFINTSASSSVTSEGTLTPDIIHDRLDDGETSSVYSCDTEGYYTSFHMDSGLKTLKEEDSSLPPTPLHSTTAFSNSSTNCTVLSAENEYELFGKGSTSTTTSSAGTVCTTLMAAESQKSLSIGPVVPERKSSLSVNSRSPSSSLERDFGSDKTGTVKRSPADCNKETVTAMIHNSENGDVSPDSGHNTSSSPIESVSSPNGAPSGSEFEYSESSDLEGVDRIERIRVKTTINSSRIPSMCVITPPHSDDESVNSDKAKTGGENQMGSKNNERPNNLELKPTETDLDTLEFNDNNNLVDNNKEINGNKIEDSNKNLPEYMTPEPIKPLRTSPQVFKATLLPLNNMFGKLRSNISNLTKRSPGKVDNVITVTNDCDAGDYVTIADVKNNNEKAPKKEVFYANDVLNKGSVKGVEETKKSGIRETEYVSLQELPLGEDGNKSLERKRQGARVTLDANGKVVYSSDSLKRRKGAHTTFEPGPYVKDLATQSPLPVRNLTKGIRPVGNQEKQSNNIGSVDTRPMSPQMNKVVIRANSKTGVVTPAQENLRMPSKIVSPSIGPMSPKSTSIRGAYVKMQEDSTNIQPNNEEHGLYASYNQYPIENQYQEYYMDQQQQQNQYIQRGTTMYSTLPTRRPPKLYQEAQTYRSYTPELSNYYPDDLTDQYGYSSLPRQPIYQSREPIYNQNTSQNHIGVPKMSNLQNQVPSNNYTPYNFNSSTPNSKEVSVPKVPMGISNFFSPIRKTQPAQPEIQNSLKISPIEPCHSSKFQSSTPQKPVNASTAVNLSNKLLSPKKSTMSNEELYAVIHRSKKKLNIKTDVEDTSNTKTPEKADQKQVETGYLSKPQNRNSWSPNNDDTETLNNVGSRQSWACSDRLGNKKSTSRLDFKRLLLQQSTKTPSIQTGKKLSAVEQLKLTKDHLPQKKIPQSPLQIADLSASPKNFGKKFANGPDLPTSPEKRPQKVMSPRTAWRFANPRSDVLSSTILEDCREDETSNGSNDSKNSPKNSFRATNSPRDTNPTGINSQKKLFGDSGSSPKNSFRDITPIRNSPNSFRDTSLIGNSPNSFKNTNPMGNSPNTFRENSPNSFRDANPIGYQNSTSNSPKFSNLGERLSPKVQNVSTFKDRNLVLPNSITNRFNSINSNPQEQNVPTSPKFTNNPVTAPNNVYNSLDRNYPKYSSPSQTIANRIGEFNSRFSNNYSSNSRVPNNGQTSQNSVANSNIVSDGLMKNNLVSKMDFGANKTEMTRSQYIQARKEAFLSVQQSNGQNKGNESPPTLETAL